MLAKGAAERLKRPDPIPPQAPKRTQQNAARVSSGRLMAGYASRLASIDIRLTVLTWMTGANLALTIEIEDLRRPPAPRRAVAGADALMTAP